MVMNPTGAMCNIITYLGTVEKGGGRDEMG